VGIEIVDKVAIYGKGGIGKSLIAANISYYYASQGKKILHIGCDPKHDSTIVLLGDVKKMRTVLDVVGENTVTEGAERIINEGKLGIHCCEAGGPPPGQGCGGRGVAKTLELIEEMNLISAGKYSVVLFDVLGDVVCGGFAAPLRLGFAQKVVIVTSEEPMSLFAANNICKAVNTYWENGIFLAGMVVNLKSNDSPRKPVERFAKKVGAGVLGFLERSPLFQEAERRRMSIFEYAGRSKESRAVREIAKAVLLSKRKDSRRPSPMSDEEFFEFIQS
jgi:nitrogenase iron protein NifH